MVFRIRSEGGRGGGGSKLYSEKLNLGIRIILQKIWRVVVSI